MVSVSPAVTPWGGVTPFSHVAPSAEEKLSLQPSLTLLIFILIPCVLLLFFLNCFLLFHRFPGLAFKKRAKRRGGSRGSNNNYPCARPGQIAHHNRPLPGCPHTSNKSLCDGCCASVNPGLETTMALGECAHVSLDPRQWKPEESPECPYFLRPPRAEFGHGSLSRSCGTFRESARSWEEVEDDGGGTRSYSEQDTRYNAAPPNTPAVAMAAGTVTPKAKCCRKTSTQRKRLPGIASITPLGSLMFDNASSIPLDTPTLFSNSSLPGPGLDSDFGVSAGISLHILSSDSDSGSHSWASGMEWDYYDPCYMRKNRLRKDKRQNHNIPVMCSKQYWV